MFEITLWFSAIALILIGTAGVIFPILPGTPFVFLGLFLAAYIDDFTKVGWPALTILGMLTLLSVAVDFFAAAVGAKRAGASPKAVWGAGVGAFLGAFFGFPGLILGPFIGAAVGEYSKRPDLWQAGKAGIGTWFGMLLGMVMKMALIFTMLVVFAIAYFS